MADEIRRIQVRIGSLSYSLITGEDEQYTRRTAARADEMIRRVMQNNPQLSQSMATVLALVNAVDDLHRLADRSSRYEARLKEIDDVSGDLRQELQRLREQNWELKKDLLDARNACRELEALSETLKAENAATPAAAADPSIEGNEHVPSKPDAHLPDEPAATEADGLILADSDTAADALNDLPAPNPQHEPPPADVIFYHRDNPLHQTDFDEYLAVRPTAAGQAEAVRSGDHETRETTEDVWPDDDETDDAHD